MNKDILYRAAVKSFRNSYHTFMSLAGDAPVGGIFPESLMQIEIARSMSILMNITLETGTQYLKKYLGMNGNAAVIGKLRKGNIDIVGWKNQTIPNILIEVKRAWNRKAIIADTERLLFFKNNSSLVDYGMIVAGTNQPSKVDSTKFFKQLESTIKSDKGTIIGRSCYYNHYTFNHKEVDLWYGIDNPEDWWYGVGCYFIE